MPLPPPPPLTERMVQLLTPAANEAVKNRSGPIYEMLVEFLLKQNADCFENRNEVESALATYIWPPHDPRDLCSDFPHIPFFCSGFFIHGEMVDVLEDDMERYLAVYSQRASIKASWIQTMNGRDGIERMKQDCIRNGTTAVEFEILLRELMLKVINEIETSTVTRIKS